MTTEKWYHFCMMPFMGLFFIVGFCVLIILFQSLIATMVEETTIQFDGECSVVYAEDNEDVNGILAAQCPDRLVGLRSDQEALFLHALLTDPVDPVIVCKKKFTEYTKETSWSCEVQKYDDGTEITANAE